MSAAAMFVCFSNFLKVLREIRTQSVRAKETISSLLKPLHLLFPKKVKGVDLNGRFSRWHHSQQHSIHFIGLSFLLFVNYKIMDLTYSLMGSLNCGNESHL